MAKSAWDGVLRALSTTPHAIRSLKGVSGYSHALAGVGVDSGRKRLVVISTEADPRIVAMAQADIQAVDTSIHVIAARPVVVDTGTLWRSPQEGTPGPTNWENLELLTTSGSADADLFSGHALLGSMLRPLFEQLGGKTSSKKTSAPLAQQDPLALDRQFGLCPIPLYQMSDGEIETILAGTDLDAIHDALMRLGVLQYFFPPPDQIALGLVDSSAESPAQIIRNLREMPNIGHPFGAKELVDENTPLAELIHVLHEHKLVIEGEHSVELTPAGQSIRSVVRFKPREGVLTKLLNRISVSLSLKDLFGGPH